MSFKISLAPVFALVIKDAALAGVVADKAAGYIQAVETIAQSTTLTGAQKLAAVKTALINDVAQWNGALAKTLSDDWNTFAGIISGAVAIYNLIKWDFVSIAPIVTLLAPASAPTLAAVAAGAAVAEKTLGPAAEAIEASAT